MAKRFTFRLETLLRIREIREREAKRQVGAKQAEIARIDLLNRQTADDITMRQAVLRDSQQGAVSAADLIRERAWIAHLRRTIVERQAARAEFDTQLQDLRDRLRQARTQKRVIEKLRERRFAEHQRRNRLREQADSDEVARQLHVLESVAAGQLDPRDADQDATC